MDAQAPSLEVDGDAAAGHARLVWSATGDAAPADYELQTASTRAFTDAETLYEGPHTASVLSGLPDGTRFFRVRQRGAADRPWSAWSTPARFDVAHHSLSLALGLCGIGALVFLTTAGYLVRANRGSTHD